MLSIRVGGATSAVLVTHTQGCLLGTAGKHGAACCLPPADMPGSTTDEPPTCTALPCPAAPATPTVPAAPWRLPLLLSWQRGPTW